MAGMIARRAHQSRDTRPKNVECATANLLESTNMPFSIGDRVAHNEIVTMDRDGFRITSRQINLRGQVVATAKIFGAVSQRDKGSTELYSSIILVGAFLTLVFVAYWLTEGPGALNIAMLFFRVIMIVLGLVAVISGFVLRARHPDQFFVSVFAPNGCVLKVPIGWQKDLGRAVVQAIARALVPGLELEKVLEWGPRFILTRTVFLARGRFKSRTAPEQFQIRGIDKKLDLRGEIYDSPPLDAFEIGEDVVAVFSLRHIYSMKVCTTPDAWAKSAELLVAEIWVRELLAFNLVLIGKKGKCKVPAFFAERADTLRELGELVLSAADDLRDREE